MPYDKVSGATTIAAAATSATVTMATRGTWIAPIGFRASCVADNATIIQLADVEGYVFYLDALAADYTTAIDKLVLFDDTQTGLTSHIPYDLTGTVIGADLGSSQPVVKGPITATWSSGTAADVLSLTFYYKSGYERTRLSLTTPNPAATVSKAVQLKTRYARIVAFRASCVTDNSSILKITDADSRVLYLDAAGKDYHAAGGIPKALVPDDTLTGLTPQTIDSTGAAAAAAQLGTVGTAVGKSPLTVEWSSNGTVGDVMTVDLFYEP